MNFQIKRSNKSVVVVQRWYVDGKQKEKHIMTIEPYTTPERLNALQIEFRESKGKMPPKTPKDIKNKLIRVSDKDIDVIEQAFIGSKQHVATKEEKKEREKALQQITHSGKRTQISQTPKAFAKKYKLKSSDK